VVPRLDTNALLDVLAVPPPVQRVSSEQLVAETAGAPPFEPEYGLRRRRVMAGRCRVCEAQPRGRGDAHQGHQRDGRAEDLSTNCPR
jgi:hypothetical protein